MVEAPVMIVPGPRRRRGHACRSATAATGAESIARGVGFNAGALRTSDAPWFDRGVTLTKTGRHYKFAHHPGPLGDGARRPQDAAARGRDAAGRGAARRARSSTRRSRSAAGVPADHPRAGRLQQPAVQVGRWRSTSTSARAAAPASSPAVARTTSRRRQRERRQGARDAVDAHRSLLHRARSTIPR